MEFDVPAVHRAGHFPAVNDALRQLPALVRAAVFQRKDFVVGGTEHRDVQLAVAHHARAEEGYVVHIQDVGPVGHLLFLHAETISNSCLCLPSRARSTQGSRSTESANSRRSYSARRPSASSRIFFFT